MINNQHRSPKGKIVLRTLAMPANANVNGDIFGGWIMSQMDIGGAILAKEIANSRVVTVRVDGMSFFKSISIGDVVTCYAKCIRIGNTSITTNIEVWVKKVSNKQPIEKKYCTTEAIFIYVSIDNQGNPKTINFDRNF